MLSSDLWQPSASIEQLKQRASIVRQVRYFFEQRGYLEVETPIMSHFGVTDVYLSNIEAKFRGETYYLHTSPEYSMKRLLAAGSGPIYQLARVFRDDELGRWHNPEFTLLEWYQLAVDHHYLIDEIDVLLQSVLHCQPLVKRSYRQIFLDICQLDPITATVSELKNALAHYALDQVLDPEESDPDQYLFLLMSHVVEPGLSHEQTPIAVYGYPPSQAVLAKINEGVADRFEIYYKGVELANGFHELTDANLQRQRFEEDNQLRLSKNLAGMAPDVNLLTALEHGLPPCSGVALGMDRLIALALNQASIAEIMAFDISRS